MDKTNFILVYKITTGTEYILYAVSLAAFFHAFMKENQQKRQLQKSTLLIFLIYVATALIILLPWTYGWMHMLLAAGLLILFSRFLGTERSFTFLLCILFHCIRSLSTMIMRSVDFLTSEWFLRNADTSELVFRNAAVNLLLIESVQFLFFLLLLRILEHQLKKGRIRLHIRELCYLLLTPVTGILFANIIVRLLVIANENQMFLLYAQYPVFIAIIPAVSALFYAGILAAVSACQRILGLQEEQQKYFMIRQQLSAMQERVREIEQLHDGLCRMKHEMKNHLTNIRGLAESGHYEEMESYIDSMNGSMKVFELSIHTGNAVTDVIINDIQKAAAASGIDFQCAFLYPSPKGTYGVGNNRKNPGPLSTDFRTNCNGKTDVENSAADLSGFETDGYNAYDIGIILHNLLRNALEACEQMQAGRKYIQVSARRRGNFFLIDVRNSFDGKVTFDRNTGLPVSTKKKDSAAAFASMHGIGLSNVKREAEKYMGDVDIQIENSTFHVTVLLQERRTKQL